MLITTLPRLGASLDCACILHGDLGEWIFQCCKPHADRQSQLCCTALTCMRHMRRRTGSTDSSKRAGAAARYANPGLLATSRAASEHSMSAASIVPSPAKPPLVPSTKVPHCHLRLVRIISKESQRGLSSLLLPCTKHGNAVLDRLRRT